MATVMISLLGGRPGPNVAAALKIKPDCLYMIVSKDSFEKGGNYENAINALPANLKPRKSFKVHPYALKETIEKCEKIVNQHPTDTIIIVSASEPKTMGFGAYDVANRLRRNNKDIDMCYTSREGLIWLFRNSHAKEPIKITLNDYFSSYGWNITQRKDQADTRFQALISLFIDHLPSSHHLLGTLRKYDRGKDKRTITCPKGLDDEQFVVLQKMEELNYVSNVQITSKQTKCTINSNEDAKCLLTGDWLEYYVFRVACGLKDDQKNPLFDECGWGVNETSGKGEIDFVGIFGGQMVVASCKTEDGIKRTWFEDLDSKVGQLGKGMCSALLISSVPSNTKTEEELEQYQKWAESRRIVLVTATNLPQLDKILRKIVRGNNNEEPKDIQYYPRI